MQTQRDDAEPRLSNEWLEEIKRRSAEYDAGLMETIPWETIRADARRRALQKYSGRDAAADYADERRSD
jgi:hypothetical protein